MENHLNYHSDDDEEVFNAIDCSDDLPTQEVSQNGDEVNIYNDETIDGEIDPSEDDLPNEEVFDDDEDIFDDHYSPPATENVVINLPLSG